MNDATPAPADALPADTPWYVRHKMRALLLTFLATTLFFGSILVTVFVLFVVNTRKSAPFQLAFEAVRDSKQVQRELGRPIELGWLALGSSNNDAGYAEFTFRVKGPTGAAGVRAIAERDITDAASPWVLVFLDVGTKSDFGSTIITLIEDKPPTGPDMPEPTPEAIEKYGIQSPIGTSETTDNEQAGDTPEASPTPE